MSKGKVLLGVSKSDSHVVANRLIELNLENQGYEVINLGSCTSIQDFMDAYTEHNDVLCIAIGNLNGHVIMDTRELSFLRKKYGVNCPVIIGGNPNNRFLNLPETKSELIESNGFDEVLTTFDNFFEYLETLVESNEFGGKAQIS